MNIWRVFTTKAPARGGPPPPKGRSFFETLDLALNFKLSLKFPSGRDALPMMRAIPRKSRPRTPATQREEKDAEKEGDHRHLDACPRRPLHHRRILYGLIHLVFSFRTSKYLKGANSWPQRSAPVQVRTNTYSNRS